MATAIMDFSLSLLVKQSLLIFFAYFFVSVLCLITTFSHLEVKEKSILLLFDIAFESKKELAVATVRRATTIRGSMQKIEAMN